MVFCIRFSVIVTNSTLAKIGAKKPRSKMTGESKNHLGEDGLETNKVAIVTNLSKRWITN